MHVLFFEHFVHDCAFVDTKTWSLISFFHYLVYVSGKPGNVPSADTGQVLDNDLDVLKIK